MYDSDGSEREYTEYYSPSGVTDMLTRLSIRNFKRFEDVDIELGSPVLFVGPNNSGKTSALQALALWEAGLRKWNEKRKGKEAPEKRPGVTINRRDLISLPVAEASLLWRGLHVRDVKRMDDRPDTKNVFIDILVEGVTDAVSWQCGFEFYFANEESFYCRPLRTGEASPSARMEVPLQADAAKLAFLPPMSGLAANETRLDAGAVNVRVGEGRTAEVLRNLCYKVLTETPQKFVSITGQIQRLFGATLTDPVYIPERGEIQMGYIEREARLDLSSAGRGLQQTLLLLAYITANPGTVLLLDEPDAHLEILRQRQIYQLLTDFAVDNGNQIIAATHSEVLLNEAAGKDVVVAFVGKPHRIDDRGSQLLKSLRDISFEHYYQAEQTGWVLYLEGSTDLACLLAFARVLKHEKAIEALERPFVHYVGREPQKVAEHYYGLRDAFPNLKGIAIFDRLAQALPESLRGMGLTWRRRELENYVCMPEVLDSFARSGPGFVSTGPLFEAADVERRVDAMNVAIREVAEALEILGKGSPWDADIKASDEFLDPVFRKFHAALGLPNLMAKKNFHELARFVPVEKIDPEIVEKLDAIAAVHAGAVAGSLSE